MSTFAPRLLTLPPRRRKPKPARRARADALHRDYPKSSCIAALVYDDETRSCYVTFRDGTNIELSDFEQIEFERWASAASPGGYWNRYLRGRY
jgi:hypothetical protein